jgi:hypothetical protein
LLDGPINRAFRGGHAHIAGQGRVDDSRGQSVDADKAKPGDDAFGGQQLRERFDVAHAVLEGHHQGLLIEQRTDERGRRRWPWT